MIQITKGITPKLYILNVHVLPNQVIRDNITLLNSKNYILPYYDNYKSLYNN